MKGQHAISVVLVEKIARTHPLVIRSSEIDSEVFAFFIGVNIEHASHIATRIERYLTIIQS